MQLITHDEGKTFVTKPSNRRVIKSRLEILRVVHRVGKQWDLVAVTQITKPPKILRSVSGASSSRRSAVTVALPLLVAPRPPTGEDAPRQTTGKAKKRVPNSASVTVKTAGEGLEGL